MYTSVLLSTEGLVNPFQSLLIALFCVLNSGLVFAASVPDDHTIRIRIEHLKSEVELKGRHILINGDKFSESIFKKKATIQLREDGSWSVRTKNSEKLYPSMKLEISGESLELDGRAAPAHVVLSHTTKSLQSLRFDAITELPLEEYLLDVVASEVPSHWPVETLKAQAVAARSYALVIQKERAGKPYHIDSSTQHQVFQYKQHKRVKNTSKIVKAVKQTKGQILVGADGQVFKTYFHAHCGGETEDPGAVWGTPDENFKPLHDKESCDTSPSGQWVAEINETEFLKYIEKKVGEKSQDNRFLSLNLKHKSNSERIETIEIASLKSTLQLRSQDFREAFGFTKIKSTIFSFEYKDGVFSFKGRGYGHGAGLCQTGSRWMGASGSNYKQILSRYYSAARLSGLDITLSKN